MTIMQQPNLLLEALSYLGRRANGSTWEHIEHRIHLRKIDPAPSFLHTMEQLKNLSGYLNDAIHLDAEELTELFLKLGYVRYDKVEGKGTFSIRGDIVDIFPVNMDMPCRIELDFETVDNIRTFDVLTQRSVDTLREISICQTDENVISKQKIQDVISKLNKDLKNVSQKLKENI